MPDLAIHLLGVPSLILSGAPRWLPHGLGALFAYLVLNRSRPQSRDQIAATFWGNQPEGNARGCLSTALWRLRHVLEPPGVPRGTFLLAGPSGEVRFNPECSFWLDVADFERVLLTSRAPKAVETEVALLEHAVGLYHGDLLEGFYEDWALSERERLSALYLQALGRLLLAYRDAGLVEQAIACGLKLLARDQLREDVHRDLMRLYLSAGRRDQALRQYESCRSVLRDELGIQPLPETEALRRSIQAAVPVESCASDRHGSLPPEVGILIGSALRRLSRAKRDLDRVLLSINTPKSDPPASTS